MDFRISKWISGFQSGFLDFRLDFWISEWISGFRWISGFQIGFLPTVYEISFVADLSVAMYMAAGGIKGLIYLEARACFSVHSGIQKKSRSGEAAVARGM